MLAIFVLREDTDCMSEPEDSRLPWSHFHEQLRYIRTEQAFDLIAGGSILDKYRMFKEDGRPSMVNTAWVMNAIVFQRTFENDQHPRIMLADHGWEIHIARNNREEIKETTLAHSIGHLLVMKYDIHHYKELYPIGREFSRSNLEVEQLCTYIGYQLITDIDKNKEK